jgi:hypothetical protein
VIGTVIASIVLVVVVVGGVALVVLRDVVSDLAKTEIRAWLPYLSCRRVKEAAQNLPSEHGDLLEVWEAELDEYRDRPVAMLLVAKRIARDRQLIVFEARQAVLEPSGVGTEGRLGLAKPSLSRIAVFVGRIFRWSSSKFTTTIHGVLRLILQTVRRNVDSGLSAIVVSVLAGISVGIGSMAGSVLSRDQLLIGSVLLMLTLVMLIVSFKR